MFAKSVLALSLIAALAACQSTTQVVDADPSLRDPLFSTVTSLEGRWEGKAGEMDLVHEFQVSSNGSVVREIMFPGSDHEMTNMYSLDGNTLVMTHYCAGGNQPHMRATAIQGGTVAFESVGVSDLKTDDEIYMGEMTLVIIDDDHIEQHWRAFKGDEVDHESVMQLHRVR